MDLDVFVSAHRAEWDRLDDLLRRKRRLTGAEADELVTLYQRTATHLSMIRSSAPDPGLIGRLTTLVARARSTVTGTRRASWRDVSGFLLEGFPAAVYRARHWWVPTALVSTALAAVLGWWIGTHPEVQAAIAAPEELRRLTRPGGEYETYYSSHPAAAFAAQVWTNNAQAAAMCLVLGVFLGLPVLWILFQNMLNLGVGIGLMSSAGRLDTFLGLVLPHGLLELTAVFVAAGTGMRLGWTVIDPGPRSRRTALADEGRAAVGMALGLALVLLVSGAIEGFVTPSSLPTWARIGIGVVAELAFLTYVHVLGGRAVRAGATGDVATEGRSATVPTAA
ncbi:MULTISPECIES: stage II sporulation protein M [Streptomyces]|uniref:Stage II sporulation protein M n=1 Tax=Streptomyces thermoviolaceus subsp. thermoviolaceus TaxID=66860 RepID=A0ABX0YYM5_STRTL|nr:MULTISPECIES: stage II sporulation protein M [Streptomyces]MCM3266793.1 stage II sporulation protein M [Streptomyces thermoviolaceus]NJP17409.1 stage II sporulation protein M [Streptomyces thermoviolaceus subsp. thermoviolaceus]RSS07347.1 stage II sporulation protein M [Streptomyces sp. WAC00469]GGV81969.1 membrane protein [Streptomyces thermoviolaceus subsp. apingens]GHB13826.1 membrane protein [Streptomyces thermoviolaceus subsp. thermoviolaceus]